MTKLTNIVYIFIKRINNENNQLEINETPTLIFKNYNNKKYYI